MTLIEHAIALGNWAIDNRARIEAARAAYDEARSA